MLGVCVNFSEEQLQMTAPGTFGTLAATFQHLCGAEQGYLQRLGSGPRMLARGAPFPGLSELTKHAARSADQLIAVAEKASPEDVFEANFDDGLYRVQAGIVLIQALHHGNDHRTHICTILGHHGLTYGDVDVWAYGDATGAIVPIGAG
jgi:uncharacterized damage-inducible protein DinB